ncbi:MAG: ATP-binding cassette domain-containing protein [Bacteriovoracaceae bacterium]|nr:ATP-binding cassette domain-containing protein [Bacteriovoracaceae bacterium]
MNKINDEKRYSYAYLLKYFYSFVKKYILQEFAVTLLIGLSITVNIGIPLINKTLVDDAIIAKDLSLLFNILYIYIGIILGGQLINVTMEYLQNSVQEKISMDIYKMLFKKMLSMKMLPLNNFSNTEIVNRFIMDADAIKSLIADFFITVLTQIIYFLGILVVMLSLSWKLTILALIPVPIYLVTFLFFNKKIRVISRLLRNKFDNLTQFINESFLGSTEIRISGSTNFVYSKFQDKILSIFNVAMKSVVQSNAISVVIGLITASGNLILWFYGGYLVIEGQLSLGTLFALSAYIGQLYDPINILAGRNFKIQSSIFAIERIHDFLNQPQEPLWDQSESKYEKGFRDSIKVSGLSFNYPESTDLVIDNKSFEINKGDRILLTGANGSGKSTFINILLRLYDHQLGVIKIDNTNIQQIPIQQYRSLFAYVPQHPFLFEGTATSNISMLDTNANLNNFKKFLSRLPFLDFFSKKSGPYSVSNNGNNLSGGQKQKLSLLRSLYKDAPIIIIDEGTSNIDAESLSKFDQFIENNLQDKTIIRVSHNQNEHLKNYKFIHFDRIMPQVYQDKIIKLIQENKLDSAKEAIESLLKHYQDINLFKNLAFIKYMQGNFSECLTLNQKALQIDPGDVYATKGLGLAFAKLGDLEKGIEHLKSAQTLDSTYFDPFYDMAVIYYENGQFENALKTLKLTPVSSNEERDLVANFIQSIKKDDKI